MSKKANKTVLGVFVVGAVVLLTIGISVFGSGMLFKKSDKYVLFFEGSVKGLSAGAPVVFRGVKIGSVQDVSLLFDPGTKDVYIPVIIEVELSLVKGLLENVGYPDYKRWIEEGLRARLDIQSFVTGQLLVAFDFYPDQPARLFGVIKQYPELPTLPVAPDIFAVMDQLPVKEIARNLQETVAGVNRLVNSDDPYGLNNAIKETTLAARSMRLLCEYLEQHPEALLKGKPNLRGE